MGPILEHQELPVLLDGGLAEPAISVTSYVQNATANIPVPTASVGFTAGIDDTTADHSRIRTRMRIYP